jgi:hypothetical protein
MYVVPIPPYWWRGATSSRGRGHPGPSGVVTRASTAATVVPSVSPGSRGGAVQPESREVGGERRVHEVVRVDPG